MTTKRKTSMEYYSYQNKRIETCLLQPHGCKQISIMISEVSLKQINNTEHCNIDSRTM